MDCLHFTNRVEALLDGALAEDERLRAAAHAARCPDCRALVAAMQGELCAAVEAPDGLAAAILAQTSGPACGQARAWLVDRADGVLDQAPRDLVDAHLRHCPGCTAVATALERLAEDLPAFAELPPDPRLVGRVLARTRRRPPWWSELGDRMRETGLRLLVRPRISWEAGCVAALVMGLAFGPSWSPARVAALEAQALIRQTGAGARAAGIRSAEAVNQAVVAVRDRTVRTAGRGTDDLKGWMSVLRSWPRRAAGAAPDLERHWRQFVQALQNRDLFSGVDALRSLGLDAGAMLAELFAASPPTAAPDAESNPNRSNRR